MGTRHLGRKLAVQALYQACTRKDLSVDVLTSFIDSSDNDLQAKSWGKDLVLGAWKHLASSDSLIEKYSIGWSLERINFIDLSILRLAFYELSVSDTPVNVILDEAVELAKEFSTVESAKFINGILGKYVADHVHRNH